MSKKNLESIISRIEKKAKYRSEVVDKRIHKYSVQESKLVDEIWNQVVGTYNKAGADKELVNIPKSIFTKPVQDYCTNLRKAFESSGVGRSSVSVTILGSNYSYIAIFKSSKNANVFKRIGDVRLPVLKKLKQSIYEAIKNNLDKKTYGKKQQALFSRIHGIEDKSGNVKGGLFNMGHVEGSSVIEHELYDTKKDFVKLISDPALSIGKQREITEILAEINFDTALNPNIHVLRSGKLVVSLYDQGTKSNNVQSEQEVKLRDEFKKAAIEVFNNIDWVGFESSPNIKKVVEGRLSKASKKAGATVKNTRSIALADAKNKSSANRKISGKTVVSESDETILGSLYIQSSTGNIKPKAARKTNWASLIAIINRRLPEQVANNMGAPGLVYRTGRFANSTRIVNVETTRDGYPSIVFDYQRDPYDVFDRAKGAPPWNTPARDPRTLVDKSVREIVQEMAIGRFYTRRA
jgi:hypothetical protein